MKRHILLTLFSLAWVFTISAQSLHISDNGVCYVFNASSMGKALCNNGSDITVGGKTFTLTPTLLMTTSPDEMDGNLVEIVYDGPNASVAISGDIAQYVEATVDGAYVSLTQNSAVNDDTCGEITYRLSGSTSDGGFSLTGSFKASIELTGVDITSQRGAAVEILNGKRIAVRVAEGSVNHLADSPSSTVKGALYCKGHLEFKQKGELHVIGNSSHAIAAKEYIEIKNTKIYVDGAVKDGINCSQYFLMESGKLQVRATGDDGVQVSFKDDTDREAEDTGTATVAGGSIDIEVSARAAKAFKVDGDFLMKGGDLTASTSGHGLWDAEASKTKASACISADGNCTIDGGTLNLVSTGSGGKGISSDGIFSMTDGSLTISTSGGLFAFINGSEQINYTGSADRIASDYKSSAKGIKSDSGVDVSGGEISIATTGSNAEGIESKSDLTISGGSITVRAADDAINSSGHMHISGGDIEVMSTGNDGLDSNGNMYISGGTVRAFGASSPECGIDVNEEEGYKLYFTGGAILGVGGNNSIPSANGSTQPYLAPSVTVTAGSAITVSDGDTTLFTFDIPADYTPGSQNGGGGRPWRVSPEDGPGGGGPGGWGGSGVIISLPELVSGSTYTVTSGSSTTSASAKP